jgi:hypothetical protein
VDRSELQETLSAAASQGKHMAQDQKHTRRAFFRGCGAIPTMMQRAGEIDSSTSTDRIDSSKSGQAGRRRKLSKTQFSIRGLLFFTALVAILLGIYREELIRHPILVFGSLIAAVLLTLLQEGGLWLFDRLLWRIFGDGDRNGR